MARRDPRAADNTNMIPLDRTLIGSLGSIQSFHLEGEIEDPEPRLIQPEEGEFFLCVRFSGATLYQDTIDLKRGVLPSKSALLVVGPAAVKVYYARGIHEGLEVEWWREDLPALHEWIEQQTAESTRRGLAKGVNLAGHGERTSNTLNLLRQEVMHARPDFEPTLLACLHELVGVTVLEESENTLAVVPADAPGTLRDLMLEVKSRPSDPWSLKDAADFASYSPFHLSRTFRQSMEYGFPDFVDRCRTEVAIGLLFDSDRSVEEVSIVAGFGSAQAMRESFKEYVGLLPSELRSLPLEVLSR